MTQSKALSTRNGLHFVKSLAEEFPQTPPSTPTPQTSQAAAKAIGYSSQPDGKLLSLKTTLS